MSKHNEKDLNDLVKDSPRNRKNINIFKVTGVTILSVIGILIAGLVVYMVIYFACFTKYSTSDPKNYRQFSGHMEKEENGIYSHLYVFPKELAKSADIKNYYYYCNGRSLFDNYYQISAEYTLSSEDYKREVERLASLQIKYKDEINKVKYDTENFEYPAYVTVYKDNCVYEYALVDDKNNKIICVYTQFIRPEDIKFDKRYLPKNFVKEYDEGLKGEENRKKDGFSMYYFPYLEGGDRVGPQK